jgi:hypothetical protein
MKKNIFYLHALTLLAALCSISNLQGASYSLATDKTLVHQSAFSKAFDTAAELGMFRERSAKGTAIASTLSSIASALSSEDVSDEEKMLIRIIWTLDNPGQNLDTFDIASIAKINRDCEDPSNNDITLNFESLGENHANMQMIIDLVTSLIDKSAITYPRILVIQNLGSYERPIIYSKRIKSIIAAEGNNIKEMTGICTPQLRYLNITNNPITSTVGLCARDLCFIIQTRHVAHSKTS